MLQDTIEVFLVLLHWIYIKILEYIFYFLPICCLLIPKFCFKGFHLLSIMLQSLLNCSRLICPWINNHIPCFIISIIFIFLQCSHLSRYIFNHGINVLLKSIQITIKHNFMSFVKRQTSISCVTHKSTYRRIPKTITHSYHIRILLTFRKCCLHRFCSCIYFRNFYTQIRIFLYNFNSFLLICCRCKFTGNSTP